MRVRFALTLLFALTATVATGRVAAQGVDPVDPAREAAVVIGHPRAAVLSLHEGAAESFLLPTESSEESPATIHGRSDRVHLLAEYEAVLAPLTAGWARYALAAYLVVGEDEKLLDDDIAEVVALGPTRRAGRLGLRIELDPGLHRLKLVSTTAVRPVGTLDWTVDRDTATLWVLVPGTAAGVASSEPGADDDSSAPGADDDSSAPSAGDALGAAGARPDQSVVEPLPLGGLPVGSQRGIASPTAAAAVNFDTGAGSVLRVKVDQPVNVWSDYELWLSEGAAGDARAALAIHLRPDSDRADLAPLASDEQGFENGVGPSREHGTLATAVSFRRPGTYHLAAHLTTQVRAAGVVAEDRDIVPFTVHVLGSPPVHGAISGLVLGEDGTALMGVVVTATDRNGAAVGASRTNAMGRYVIERLDPGSYLVRAEPRHLNYIGEWYDDSPSIHGADPVQVKAGVTTVRISFALTPGATIAGRVVDASGAGLGGIEIAVGMLRTDATPTDPRSGPGVADPTAADLARTRTNDDGYYSIDSLRAGAYWVRARDPEGRYLEEYYDDKTAFGQADKVWVRAGKVTEGIDFELASGGAIAGQVREQTVLGVIIPLPGISVEARYTDDPDGIAARAVTNREGEYRLAGLDSGEYLVRAADPSGRHATEWFEESATPDQARPVPVKPGETTEPINFTLEPVAARTRVFVAPSVTSVRAGQSARVAVSVESVADLGAFETELAWDPQVFRVDGVAIGEFLGSTGRRVLPVEPQIDNESGHLVFGAASLGDQPGPSGGGILFHLELTGLALGHSRLGVAASQLASPAGTEIRHETTDGSVRVGECMFGDFDCNCVIDITDVMAVVSRWGTVEGDPDYDPLYDLDSDGDIDIVDVQIEADLWGLKCDEDPEPSPDTGAGEALLPQPGGASTDHELDGTSVDATSGVRHESDRSAERPTVGSELGPIVEPGQVPPVEADSSGGPARHLSADMAVGRTSTLPEGATISLTATPSVASVGDTVTIGVDISDVGEVAGFELEIAFDPQLLRFVETRTGDFLSSTGRTVVPLGPTAEGGTVTLGAFSLPGAPAPSGEGRLAELVFEFAGIRDATVGIVRAVAVDPMDTATTIGGGTATISVKPPETPTSRSFVPLAIDG